MSKALTRTVRLVSLAAIAMSVAACEPDDGAGNLSHFSLAEGEAPFDLGLEDAGLGGGIGDLLPAALPLLAGGGGDYGLAPSWDYARGDYVDYAPGDPYDYYGYEEPYGGYYDAGYYDDVGYYDQSAGSSDFMWLALAALIAAVIGDSPPDYGFDHYGVQPWAWRTGDGYYRLVEPIYGGNRYYYYAPGADRPFLVRDPWFSYGYRDDRLVALYDRDGRAMDERAARRQRKAAQQYLTRAEALYRAARVDARTGVAVRDWEQRRGALASDQRRWREAKAEQAAWRQWDKKYERGLRERWERESAAREQVARRVENWREASYRGPAPRLYARERTEAQRVDVVQQRDEARRTRSDQRRALVQRREAAQDTARSRLALADGQQRGRELVRERKEVRDARSAAAEQSRRRDLAVQREERIDKARGERQQRAQQQNRVRAERQAAAEQQGRAARQERVRVERQASAERQQRAAREQQERARAERQAAQRQQQEQARQVAQQQRAAQQERARAERQASAARQQRAQQVQARAEQQAAQRRQEEQARQAQQARAQRQQAQRQARAQQQQAQPADAPARGQGRGKRDKG